MATIARHISDSGDFDDGGGGAADGGDNDNGADDILATAAVAALTTHARMVASAGSRNSPGGSGASGASAPTCADGFGMCGDAGGCGDDRCGTEGCNGDNAMAMLWQHAELEMTICLNS